MEDIQDFLVVGVRVNRGHKTLIDAEGIIQNFGDGGHAVGGAGSVGDDIMFRGVVCIFVDTQHDGDVFIGGGGGNEYLFRAAL